MLNSKSFTVKPVLASFFVLYFKLITISFFVVVLFSWIADVSSESATNPDASHDYLVTLNIDELAKVGLSLQLQGESPVLKQYPISESPEYTAASMKLEPAVQPDV